MFDFKRSILEGEHIHKYSLFQDAEPLRYADVINLWQHNEAFRALFISTLAEVPFSAYRWETPPVNSKTINRAFEFVILDSPWLALPPDPLPFAQYYNPNESEEGIVVFENLGKDATLVVPSPRGSHAAYGHLAAFTRQASASQNHALWHRVGETLEKRISHQPVWLSTHGGGVSWLHIRLDSKPKYYGYHPYK